MDARDNSHPRTNLDAYRFSDDAQLCTSDGCSSIMDNLPRCSGSAHTRGAWVPKSKNHSAPDAPCCAPESHRHALCGAKPANSWGSLGSGPTRTLPWLSSCHRPS